MRVYTNIIEMSFTQTLSNQFFHKHYWMSFYTNIIELFFFLTVWFNRCDKSRNLLKYKINAFATKKEPNSLVVIFSFNIHKMAANENAWISNNITDSLGIFLPSRFFVFLFFCYSLYGTARLFSSVLLIFIWPFRSVECWQFRLMYSMTYILSSY